MQLAIVEIARSCIGSFVTENLVDRGISGDTKNVLIFDGDCGFCTASARWIEARGPRVEAWQTLDLAELRLTVADVDEAAWWIDETGRKHRGHSAIGHALRAAGGGWGFVGAVLVRPPVSWLAKPVYTLVARNRDKLPGDACELKP